MVQQKVDVTGIHHAERGYVVRQNGSPYAKLWVVQPELMTPESLFDCFEYIFSEDGLLEQINLRIRKKDRGFFALLPLLANDNGITALYRKGVPKVVDLEKKLGDEGVGAVCSDLITSGYDSLAAVYRNSADFIHHLPHQILQHGIGFDVENFFKGREYQLKNRIPEQAYRK